MEKTKLLVGNDPTKINFIAAISHEMRTPLAAVLGFAEILEQDDVEPEERRQVVSAILRNGQLLLRLVDDILDLARLESLRMDLQGQECSLKDFMDDIQADLRMKAQEKGIELIVEGPKSHVYVVTDVLRLKQLLLNVVGNAVKFTRAGAVRVQLQVIEGEIKESRRPCKVVFQVHDTGIGISPDGVEKLFNPFAQADTSIARNYGGTGLGLVISRNLARLMGGDLKLISSKVDVGSVFEVSIASELGSEKTPARNYVLPEVNL